MYPKQDFAPIAASTAQIDIRDLRGTWRRALLQDHLGRQDRTTQVTWVQGTTAFGDLRQSPSALGVRAAGLRDVTAGEAALMAQQEGFGGTLVQHADHFEWVRAIDYQPKGVRRDRGTLTLQGDTLVEAGYELAYIEHWHRDAGPAVGASALRLVQSATGRAGLLVRTDDRFAFVRDRVIPLASLALGGPLAPGRQLADLLREASSLEAMQDLVDCEISIGSTIGWRIERSTLPWRVGASLDPDRSAMRLVTADVGPFGEVQQRSWTIVDEEA